MRKFLAIIALLFAFEKCQPPVEASIFSSFKTKTKDWFKGRTTSNVESNKLRDYIILLEDLGSSLSSAANVQHTYITKYFLSSLNTSKQQDLNFLITFYVFVNCNSMFFELVNKFVSQMRKSYTDISTYRASIEALNDPNNTKTTNKAELIANYEQQIEEKKALMTSCIKTLSGDGFVILSALSEASSIAILNFMSQHDKPDLTANKTILTSQIQNINSKADKLQEALSPKYADKIESCPFFTTIESIIKDVYINESDDIIDIVNSGLVKLLAVTEAMRITIPTLGNFLLTYLQNSSNINVEEIDHLMQQSKYYAESNVKTYESTSSLINSNLDYIGSSVNTLGSNNNFIKNNQNYSSSSINTSESNSSISSMNTSGSNNTLVNYP